MILEFADTASAIGGWSQIVLAAGVLGASGLGLHRWAKRNIADPLKAVPEIQKTLKENHGSIREIQGRVTRLEEQMVPNHGSSLRDSNDRTEVILRAVAEHVGVDVNEIVQVQTPPAKEFP